MFFDTDNPTVRKCADGMMLEAMGQTEEARQTFREAWDQASTDLERCIAAHYVARHQESPEETLHWDEQALQYAQRVQDDSIQEGYSSLYFNIAKDHEALNDADKAKAFYLLAKSFEDHLPDDGYGKMIRAGIAKGLERVS